jgi:hypothetical protein
MDIVIGHASTDEVLLAMLHRKSLKQSLLNLHSITKGKGGAESAMMDIVIGHASMDEVLLAMFRRKSLKQSLLNLHSYSSTSFSSFSLVCMPLHAFT